MASPLRLHSDELLFFFDITLKETRQCDDFLYTEFFIILPTNYPTFTILSQVPYLSKPNIFCWSVSAIVTRETPSAQPPPLSVEAPYYPLFNFKSFKYFLSDSSLVSVSSPCSELNFKFSDKLP